MIIHFINLSCWRKAWPFIASNDVVYCDTVTMRLLILALTKASVKTVSGVKFFNEIKGREMSFLIGHKQPFDKKFILPNYIEGNIFIDDALQKFLKEINTNDVCIGISSPKQNELARLLEAKRPDLRYLCFGAAIYQSNDYKLFYDSLRINWLYFLIKDPVRSLNKITLTIIAIYQILFDTKVREDFINFTSSHISKS